MSRKLFKPTAEQKAVIAHSGSAFISACPGTGKTQVLVERARCELKETSTGQGLVFLSFTNAAISELKSRLQSETLLLNPAFPHYVGTFDTFIWQFFIAPLGIPGKMIPEKAKLGGFDASAKPGLTAKYEASAKHCRERFLARGELGFGDVRSIVKSHLTNLPLSTRLSAA